jgi:hypothetical protein
MNDGRARLVGGRVRRLGLVAWFGCGRARGGGWLAWIRFVGVRLDWKGKRGTGNGSWIGEVDV